MDHLAGKGVPAHTGAQAGRRGPAPPVQSPGSDRQLSRGDPPRRVNPPTARRSAKRWRGCIWPAPASAARPGAIGAGLAIVVRGCHCAAGGVPDGLEAEIDRELTELERAWPLDLPRGVIHADLFLTMRSSRAIGCRHHRLLLRLPRHHRLRSGCLSERLVLRARWRVQHHQGPPTARGLPRRRLRPPSWTLAAAGPRRRLRFLLTRLFDWQNRSRRPGQPKDPLEYLEKLRFHRGVSGPGAYGLD